ncbi:MAG TPA: GNAT family N-acetyltransferase [Bacillota bacterium]|nr:GNAT family N-acetyltransferase [Bacillota bacterium]
MQTIKRLNITKDYESIFELSQFAFQYKLNPNELEQKKQEASRHIIWGVMDEEEIAAKLHLIPLSVYMNGKEMDMGGVSAVATWPEYRRKGMVKQLLHHALKYMKQNGQTISYLFPFSFAYYRKYGWELTFNEKKYKIPMLRFPKQSETPGYVRRKKPDVTLLHTIYSTYAKQFGGMLVRDEKWWNDRILNKDMHVTIAYNDQNEPNGYILFNVKKDVFNVIDMAYTSNGGLNLLLSFIGNHDSMAETVEMTVSENDQLSFILDEARFEQKVNPYFMARIVDVHAFLKQFPFAKGEEQITLHVDDDFFPENTGTYHLHRNQEGTSVTFINGDKKQTTGIHCSVQKLTSMCLGYIRPLTLLEMGLIQGRKSDVGKLDKIIPVQQPYFADFF